MRVPDEACRADTEGRRVGNHEILQLEASIDQPALDLVDDPGRAGIPRPHHARTRRAQAEKEPQRGLDLTVADVPQDTADEHEVGWAGSRIDVREARVALDNLEAAEAGGGDRRTGDGGVVGIPLDESSDEIAPAAVTASDRNHVMALPGAHADHPQRPFRELIQRFSEQVPYNDKTQM